MRSVTEEEIYRAILKAEKLDPWLAQIIRKMVREMRELRDQHAAALFVQGLGG